VPRAEAAQLLFALFEALPGFLKTRVAELVLLLVLTVLRARGLVSEPRGFMIVKFCLVLALC
jgi:hypothetical protein